MSVPQLKPTNRFIGASSKKMVQFMDKDIEISKLTINQVINIQKITKEAADSDLHSIVILSAVIRAGAEELRDFDQQSLQDFPMEELATLSNHIMEFSGLSQQ